MALNGTSASYSSPLKAQGSLQKRKWKGYEKPKAVDETVASWRESIVFKGVQHALVESHTPKSIYILKIQSLILKSITPTTLFLACLKDRFVYRLIVE